MLSKKTKRLHVLLDAATQFKAMEWLKSTLASAQAGAQEAAEKARVLAAPALARAVEVARATADEASGKLAALNLTGAATGAGAEPGELDPQELAAYGINDDLRALLASLTYSTFRREPGAPLCRRAGRSHRAIVYYGCGPSQIVMRARRLSTSGSRQRAHRPPSRPHPRPTSPSNAVTTLPRRCPP